jgi:hypothetical protein
MPKQIEMSVWIPSAMTWNKLEISCPTTRREGACGGRGGIQLLLILDLGTRWGEWSASRPGRALPPGKGLPVPIGQEAGWASEPVWTQRLEGKSFRLRRGSNPDRPVVQSLARRYTDWATPTPNDMKYRN